MTVNFTTAQVTFLGNDSTKVFNFGFPLYDLADMQVFLTDITTGEDTQQLSNFTVNPATPGTFPTIGTVTFPVSGSPIDTNTKITLRRKTPYAQEFLDLGRNQIINAGILEDAIDRVVGMIQQNQTLALRSLKVGITEGELSVQEFVDTLLIPTVASAIIDNLTTANPAQALSANQGVVISDLLRIFSTIYDYAIGQNVIGSDDKVYRSRVTPNVNNDPVSSPTQWELFIDPTQNGTSDDRTASANQLRLVQEQTNLSPRTWLPGITYFSGQFVIASDGQVYRSNLGGANTGNDPVSSPTEWSTLFSNVLTGTSILVGLSEAKGKDLKDQLDLLGAAPVKSNQAENETGTDDAKFVSPLGIRQAFRATGSAPVFAVRVWGNFDGSAGATARRADGNVSSFIEEATADYTLTFSTAIEDDKYGVTIFSYNPSSSNNNFIVQIVSKTTTSIRFRTASQGGAGNDSAFFEAHEQINVIITR